MDWINSYNDCPVDNDGLIPWMKIRAGEPSKFREIRMVGDLYDKNGAIVSGGSSGAEKLEDLNDCKITNPSDKQVLAYDFGTGDWINTTNPAGVTKLSQLEDCAITNPTPTQVLTFNGTNWSNQDSSTGVVTSELSITVDSDIAQTAPPIYKTLAETVAVVTANPTIKYTIQIKKSDPITSLIAFPPANPPIITGINTESYQFGKLVPLEFSGANCIINDVEMFKSLQLNFNNTTNTFNLFNNSNNIHEFQNCEINGADTGNAVFVLFSNNASIRFEHCDFTILNGAPRQLIIFEGGSLLLNDVVFFTTGIFHCINLKTVLVNISGINIDWQDINAQFTNDNSGAKPYFYMNNNCDAIDFVERLPPVLVDHSQRKLLGATTVGDAIRALKPAVLSQLSRWTFKDTDPGVTNGEFVLSPQGDPPKPTIQIAKIDVYGVDRTGILPTTNSTATFQIIVKSFDSVLKNIYNVKWVATTTYSYVYQILSQVTEFTPTLDENYCIDFILSAVPVALNDTSLSNGMGLTYNARSGEFSNNYTSESATMYTFLYDDSGEPQVQVPSGQVLFLNFGNQSVDNTVSTAKVWVSYVNETGVNLYGTGYLEGINRPGNKYQILVKHLLDNGEYLRANIIDSVENDILQQWELLITTPSVNSIFGNGSALAVSIEHYPLLEKLLDVGLVTPVSGQVLKWDGSLWTNSDDASAITKEPTGFDNPANVIVTYDLGGGSRTITLNGTFRAYWRGQPVPELTNGWISPEHPIFVGNYFLYYDGTNFVWSDTPWTFDMLQIAFISVQGPYFFGMRECHGMMPWQVHQELHRTIGTYLVSGGDLSNYVLNSTTADNRRPDISLTVLADEDLQTNLDPLLKTDNASSPYCYFKLSGSSVPNFIPNYTDIIQLSTGVPQYNLNTNGTWSDVNFSNNAYGKIFMMAMPVTYDSTSQAYRYVFIMPQQVNSSLTTIQAVTFASVNLGSFSTTVAEFLPLAEIIIRQTGGGWTLISVNKITGARQNLVSTASGLTSVSTDNTTVIGTGLPSNPLHTPSYTWRYYGTYDHGISIPVLDAGEFALDANNGFILIKYTDSNSADHQFLLRSIEFLSQIILKVSSTQRNRYCIESYAEDIPNAQVEYSYQTDIKLTVAEIAAISLTIGKEYELEFIRTPGTTLDALSDVVITNPSDGQVLTFDTIMGWQNETPSGGGAVAMAEINFVGSEALAVSPSNTGDWTILNVTSPSFTANNSGVPLNPTWSQHGTYPCALVYNSTKAVSLKIEWNIKFSSIPAQSFDIGIAFNDGIAVAIDSIASGVLSYSGTKVINYAGDLGSTSNLFLSMRCNNASNQSVTITKFNYSVVCDRAIT